jgi:hypothetical protein
MQPIVFFLSDQPSYLPGADKVFSQAEYVYVSHHVIHFDKRTTGWQQDLIRVERTECRDEIVQVVNQLKTRGPSVEILMDLESTISGAIRDVRRPALILPEEVADQIIDTRITYSNEFIIIRLNRSILSAARESIAFNPLIDIMTNLPCGIDTPIGPIVGFITQGHPDPGKAAILVATFDVFEISSEEGRIELDFFISPSAVPDHVCSDREKEYSWFQRVVFAEARQRFEKRWGKKNHERFRIDYSEKGWQEEVSQVDEETNFRVRERKIKALINIENRWRELNKKDKKRKRRGTTKEPTYDHLSPLEDPWTMAAKNQPVIDLTNEGAMSIYQTPTISIEEFLATEGLEVGSDLVAVNSFGIKDQEETGAAGVEEGRRDGEEGMRMEERERIEEDDVKEERVVRGEDLELVVMRGMYQGKNLMALALKSSDEAKGWGDVKEIEELLISVARTVRSHRVFNQVATVSPIVDATASQ